MGALADSSGPLDRPQEVLLSASRRVGAEGHGGIVNGPAVHSRHLCRRIASFRFFLSFLLLLLAPTSFLYACLLHRVARHSARGSSLLLLLAKTNVRMNICAGQGGLVLPSESSYPCDCSRLGDSSPAIAIAIGLDACCLTNGIAVVCRRLCVSAR